MLEFNDRLGQRTYATTAHLTSLELNDFQAQSWASLTRRENNFPTMPMRHLTGRLTENYHWEKQRFLTFTSSRKWNNGGRANGDKQTQKNERSVHHCRQTLDKLILDLNWQLCWDASSEGRRIKWSLLSYICFTYVHPHNRIDCGPCELKLI